MSVHVQQNTTIKKQQNKQNTERPGLAAAGMDFVEGLRGEGVRAVHNAYGLSSAPKDANMANTLHSGARHAGQMIKQALGLDRLNAKSEQVSNDLTVAELQRLSEELQQLKSLGYGEGRYTDRQYLADRNEIENRKTTADVDPTLSSATA